MNLSSVLNRFGRTNFKKMEMELSGVLNPDRPTVRRGSEIQERLRKFR